jgi:hypothetical protein
MHCTMQYLQYNARCNASNAGEMAVMQVRMTDEQLAGFRDAAAARGMSLTAMVLAWGEALANGEEGVLAGPGPRSNTLSNTGNAVMQELLEQLGRMAEAMQEQSRVHAEVQAAQVKALTAQTALLERLTQQGGMTPPHGGTERIPVVLTPSEDARPVISTRFTGFEDHSGTDPASGGEERRGATDEDLVVGARVWIRPWGCWGEVLEAPAGPRGPAYVKADAEGDSRMPGHFSASQLEVLAVSEPQEDEGVVGQGVAA